MADKRIALQAAPLFVELTRLDDPADPYVTIDVFRGDVRVEISDIERGKFYHSDGVFAPAEIHQVNGVLAAEWQAWSEEDQKPATDIVDLVEALKQSLEGTAQ